MEEQGGITVRRALELPALRGGLPEVVTGADRLHRTVRWVHAGEAPNIASLLKGGELLLTTGLAIGARPAEQRTFVRRLAERGIAALVVELGPRFSQLPVPLVEAARAAGLPLVQLHREVPFVAVTEEVHTEIVNGHYALLRQAEEVHRQCTEALLSGGGIPRVLRILSGFAANPVFLETADGQLLYAADGGSGPARPDPLQVWEGLRGQRGPGDRLPAGSLVVDVPGGAAEGGTGPVRARLVLTAVSGELLPVHRMAAERAAGVLAVVLMQARQEEELAARGRGDFLTDLAEGRVAEEDAQAQARVLGFRPGDGPLLPAVMRVTAAEHSPRGAGPCWPGRSWRSWPRWASRRWWACAPWRAGCRCCWGCAPRASARRWRTAWRRRCGRGQSGPVWPRRAVRRPSWWWVSRAAGRRRPRACGTRPRRRLRRRACRRAPGTTRGGWTSTCCCGGCTGTTRRASPRSSTGRSGPCGRTTRRPGRRCCPPWRRTWRMRGARRRRHANCT